MDKIINNLPIPDLDDKTFEELFNEAIARIPVYFPEWTDHNLSDPGITFIDLFAWLADMQIYSLNQLTERNYLKFLKLLNEKPKPASPAKIDVTFTTDSNTLISKGTKIMARIEKTDEIIYFETDKNLEVLNVKLGKIVSFANMIYTDHTNANEQSQIFYNAFGEKADKGSILYLGFTNLNNAHDKTLTIKIYLYEDDLPPRGDCENICADAMKGSRLSTKTYLSKDDPFTSEKFCADAKICADAKSGNEAPQFSLRWEWKDKSCADAMKGWSEFQRLKLQKDDTVSMLQSGIISFKIPKNISNHKLSPYTEDNYDLFWIRCRVMEKGYEIPPRINKIVINATSATQWETVRDSDPEYLGISSGLPNQVLSSRQKPMVTGTQKVTVSETWEPQNDLRNSRTQDNHYQEPGTNDLCGRNEGKIIFGDGKNGRIPPKDADIIVSYSTHSVQTKLNKTINEEYIGKSSGLPNQQFELKKIFMTIHELTIHEKWKVQDDFDASGPEDNHYLLIPDEGKIIFGDGVNGRIPPKGSKIIISYKYGGGESGNIPENTPIEVIHKDNDHQDIKAQFERLASAGTEKETLDDAISRLREDLKKPYRAVTPKDYEDLAKDTPGLRVARAHAVAYPKENLVKVVVVPHVPHNSTLDRPTPSKAFIKAVCNHLDKHRLITTNLYIVSPKYVEVSVYAEVVIKPRNDIENRKNKIVDALREFLNPLKGGPDKHGWQFGRSVYQSEIYEVIEAVDGVDCITQLTLKAGNSSSSQKNIIISPLQLVCSGSHSIRTRMHDTVCKD